METESKKTPILDNLLQMQRMASFDISESPNSCLNLFIYRKACAKDYLLAKTEKQKEKLLFLIKQCNDNIKEVLVID